MDSTKLSTVAKWAEGALSSGDPDREIVSICTDSRRLRPGDLFVALQGENFDGHTFIEKAMELGAAGVIATNVPQGLRANFTVIKVADTLAALQSIAAQYRRSLPLKVVAITGSNGKTSTKDLTAAVLGEQYRVCKTQGNFNNHIGLPLTMLSASSADDFGVFEIGMNHPGEVAPLATLAKPDGAIITNIGVAHIEFMKTREAIAREKGMLAEVVEAEGVVILSADDDFAVQIADRARAHVVTAGIDAGQLRATHIKPTLTGNRFTLETPEQAIEAELFIPGEHMIRNAVLAVAIGLQFGLSLQHCAAGLKKVQLTDGRLQIKNVGGIRIIDDSYNANPDSMVAALETLAKMPTNGRRIAVLGWMGELGEAAAEGHTRVGRAVGEKSIDCVATVGIEAENIAAGARRTGVAEVLEFCTTEEAGDWLRDFARNGDTVLIKGSRAAKMEETLAKLETAREISRL